MEILLWRNYAQLASFKKIWTLVIRIIISFNWSNQAKFCRMLIVIGMYGSWQKSGQASKSSPWLKVSKQVKELFVLPFLLQFTIHFVWICNRKSLIVMTSSSRTPPSLISYLLNRQHCCVYIWMVRQKKYKTSQYIRLYGGCSELLNNSLAISLQFIVLNNP